MLNGNAMRRRTLSYKTLFKGQILIQTLILTALAGVFITVLTNLGLSTLSTVTLSTASEQAFQIAEAGVEYYRWHLAHAPQDFQNGTGLPGPYVIPYKDRDSIIIGSFTLDITPPPVGSTVVTIRSTGKVNVNPAVVRKVEVKLGVPSWAKYSVVANANMNFGPGTEVFGPIHSNGGIRFDGVAYNIGSSGVSQYNDPDHSGQDEFGVHTHVSPIDPLPPAAVPDRPDVFKTGRQFPVPAIDFTGVTATLASLKAQAQASGNYFAPSGGKGYELVFRPDDTVSVYKVTSLKPKPGGCSSEVSDNDWGIWSIQATSTVGTYPIPSDGVFFFEDDVWVSGSVNTARATVAVGRFPENPSSQASITFNSDITYAAYDGSNSLGFIAQNDINVGLYSKDFLRIDGALIAKNGRVGRFYYRKSSGPQDFCGPEALRNTITLYGMIGTNERYGFSWSCSGVYCSGYQNRQITYDPNLLYSPPPGFPLTSSQYEVISWKEVK